MSYLCQIALGPVQGFIASARRTRDMWFGSYVLSEISRATALSLVGDETQAELIFPSVPPNLKDAEGEPVSLKSGHFLVVNILLAKLPCCTRDEALATIARARLAAETRWGEACADAKSQINNVHTIPHRRRDAADTTEFLRNNVWTAQLSDVIEFYAAAVQIADDGNDYSSALGALKRGLAARKASRVFRPLVESTQLFSLPKSSLDGAQSTVVQEADDSTLRKRIERTRRRLGIEPAEQLDTAGMVKRVVGRARSFVPVARIAVQPWLETLSPTQLKQLQAAYNACCAYELDAQLGSKIGDVASELFPWVADFAFDAQLLYLPRIEAARTRFIAAEECDDPECDDPDELRRVNDAADGLIAQLRSLARSHGAPTPYYAMLFADGDRMGELLDGILTHNAGANAMSRHQAVSQALSRFAQGVPRVVNKFSGAAIYSGGDDVLALVPLNRAVGCAKALAEKFAQCLQPFATQPNAQQPSLSVGLAIAHFMEPLGDVRRQAERALELAKGNNLQVPPERKRNALGIIVKPRGASEIKTRMRWDEVEPFCHLQEWVKQLSDAKAADALPNGLPHEIVDTFAKAAQIFGKDNTATSTSTLELYRALLSRTLRQKRHPHTGDPLAQAVRDDLLNDLAGPKMSLDEAREAANRLVLARWFALRKDPDRSEG